MINGRQNKLGSCCSSPNHEGKWGQNNATKGGEKTLSISFCSLYCKSSSHTVVLIVGCAMSSIVGGP